MFDDFGILLFFPNLYDLRSGLSVILAGLLMASAGSHFVGRRAPIDLRLIAGWGALCIGLTLWGTLTSAPMHFFLLLYSVAALAGLSFPRAEAVTLSRMALLSLPLWLVLLPAMPSQMDTWLNLLPNAAYLYDRDAFPADNRPPSYSFLPAAPYNTQFAAYFASKVAGVFAANALTFFNLLLLCMTALLFARAVARSGKSEEGAPLSFAACAIGFLLAIPLNPAFVPRVFLGSYGETALAVTLVYAVWLGARMFGAANKGLSFSRDAAAIALTLAAMVNIKQSGLGLMLAFIASLGGLGLLCLKGQRVRWALLTLLICAPALIEYGAWRFFVGSHFLQGELKPLPFAEWHFDLIPQILLSMLRSVIKAPLLLAATIATFAGAILALRRRRLDERGVTLALVAAIVVVFNLYLIAAYVGHFPPGRAAHAHSYVRYLSQLSIAVTFALTLWLAEPLKTLVAPWIEKVPRQSMWLAGTAALFPLLLAPMLRFDLNPPQPAVWALAADVAAHLKPGAKLGLIVPPFRGEAVASDNGEYGPSFIRGAILFLPPRTPVGEVKTLRTVNAKGLEELKAAGIEQALVSCTPPEGLAGAPGGVAAFLILTDGVWSAEKVWPYPAAEKSTPHWSHLMPHEAFCADVASRS